MLGYKVVPAETLPLLAMSLLAYHRSALLLPRWRVFEPHYDASNVPLPLPPTTIHTGIPNTLGDQTTPIRMSHHSFHSQLVALHEIKQRFRASLSPQLDPTHVVPSTS